MEPHLLKRLLSVKDWTFAKLREGETELAEAIQALLRRGEAKRFIDTLTVDDDTRRKLLEIDVTRVHGDVVEHLRAKLVEFGVDPKSAGGDHNPPAPKPPPDQSIGATPEVASSLALAHVHEVASVAGLAPASAQAVAAKVASVGALDDRALGSLVADKTLTDAQARSLGLSSSVYQLLEAQSPLATAAVAHSFASLGGKQPRSTLDLARVPASEWQTLLTSKSIAPPAGQTVQAYSNALAARFGALHPSVALFSRLPALDTKQVTNDASSLRVLLAKNPVVVGARFDSLDVSGLSSAQVASLRDEHARLVTLVRGYPGLGLERVLDDPQLSAEQRTVTVQRRVALVDSLVRKDDAESLMRADLTEGSADLDRLGVTKLDASAEERALVASTLRSYQRVYVLARRDPADSHALLAAGHASAVSVATLHFDSFASNVALTADKAKSVWNDARMSLADMTLTAGAMLDIIQGLFGRLGVGNEPPSAADYLKKLAGFQDLFGSLSFCDCEECQSILGAAAYFVDLMKFVDENIRDQFAGHPNHPLDLKTRRPDLWSLELSCDNTNDLVATLDLVDEILENFIAQRLGYSGPLTDRPSIQDLVYRQTLPARNDSFRQPFFLPLARTIAYLGALAGDLASVAESAGVTGSAWTQAVLGASQAELGIVTTPDVQLDHQARYYGIAFGGTAGAVDQVDAQLLVQATGLSRKDLGLLVATAFVAAGGAHVVIVAGKLSSDDVQNDVEWVRGLTADALDRMHRFTRVVRMTGWAVTDLDLVLTALGETALGSTGADGVARVLRVQKSLKLSVADAAALVGPLPQSLLDRAFNTPSFVAADGTFPKPTTHFIEPSLRHATPAPSDPALPRLLTGLAVNLAGLATLVRALAPHLAQEASPGFDVNAPSDDNRYFVLSTDNLTLLYRHARLAQALGVSPATLFEMLGCVGLDHVASSSDLQSLLSVAAFIRSSGRRVDDVAVSLGRSPLEASRYLVASDVAAAITSSAATVLEFSDTVFAVAFGTTEQGSRDLVANNAGIIESVDATHWRLRAGVDLTTATITIPATATIPTPPSGTRPATADDVRGALKPYLPSEVAVRSLATALHTDVDKTTALLRLAGQSLSVDAVTRAIRGDGPIAPLVAVVGATLPLAVAFAPSAWDAAAIDFARGHAALFGPDPLPQTAATATHPHVPFLSLDQMRATTAYAKWVARRLAADATATQADAEADLATVLTSFDAGTSTFPTSSDPAAARALGIPPSLVIGLRGRITLPSVAILALDRIDRAAQMATSLGVDGETLGGMVSNDYLTLSRGADALYAAVGARYTDEATRASKLDEAEQPVREAKRDALGAYLIRSITPQLWASMDALYEYFLIDVEAGGCSETSRVVSATTTVQLYVHRVIMNLEIDGLAKTDPNHVELKLPADAAAEWPWRKNYRVWQANRKVFLWPENYLEPDLRDDKTPLFRDLETTLLQTDISDQNVLDSYTTYLAGFEEVASLTIAGAYHEVRSLGDGVSEANVGDVLHLFGVSSSDPPNYYYRTIENLISSGKSESIPAVYLPWQKIPVQISGRKVSPIVHRGRLHVFWTDIRTRSLNVIDGGSSEFAGYRHKMTLKVTTLRPDGTWSVPQEVQLPQDYHFTAGAGLIDDTFTPGPDGGTAPLDPTQATQKEAKDDYTISGPNWDWVWPQSLPSKLQIQFRDFFEHADVDLFTRTATPLGWDWPSVPYSPLLCAKAASSGKTLYFGTPTWMFWPYPGYANAIIDDARLNVIALENSIISNILKLGLYTEAIANLPGNTLLVAIPGSERDAVIQTGGDVLLIQGSVRDDGRYVLRRLGTTLVEDIARRLFEDGLDSLLDTQTQLALAEAGLPIALVGTRVDDRSNAGKLDFSGPYGDYYRELFFHIPFLIANALNSRGRYAAAQRWYHYIFDPTSTEEIDVTGVPPADVAHRLLDRVWRYREFRGLDVAKLRDVLTDPVSIALYRKDPFNPWAIARHRISAFQKAIVMRYVENLLDWADSLFTQFTMESVNEALMLYVMASDILGPRPVEIGDCGTDFEPKTYEHIAPLVDSASEVLIELETWTYGGRVSPWTPWTAIYSIDPAIIAHAVEMTLPLTSDAAVHVPPRGVVATSEAAVRTTASVATKAGAPKSGNLFRGLGWNKTNTASWGPPLGNSAVKSVDTVGGRTFDHAWRAGAPERIGRYGWHIIRQFTPVFCVPANADLLALWDRVEDRLYKIRHCMDIDGQKRQLALFAPPINPMQLVAMRAAGLDLEDVLGTASGTLPPYRFTYLIDRAKAFASSLTGFGSALLAALEKKDGEELNRLRLTQQMNLATLTAHMRQLEINVANESLEALNRQLDETTYRRDYYANLVSENRNGWEVAESISRHGVSLIHATEGALGLIAAISKALPQIGSPFAMKYGGVEIGGSFSQFAEVTGTAAALLDAVAASTGLEGNFARRSDGWSHQKTLGDWDIKVLTRQINAAAIRLDIANRAFDLHQASIGQLQDLIDFTDGKFSNLGLYTWLSGRLQRMYRAAYQNATALAKLAELAYRFERGDDTSPALNMSSYWDPTHAGLLAGEQLLIDLQTLERRYMETNYRTLEIDQTFALSQVDAQALVNLRQTGVCAFTLNEAAFDLFYPGHYKRRIKAVRLTIPCVTGPYVNVSATLELDRSWVRPTPTLGAPLVEVPPSRSIAIATSTAQNDAGVFEFSFRDERYMPFEGLGAISRWNLTLPRAFKQFDYQTINDVIVTVSYMSEQDGHLRDAVEGMLSGVESTIVGYYSGNPTERVLSLRQDFSATFTRLLRSPAGTSVSFEINDRHFPLFAQGRAITVDRAALLLRTAAGASTAGLQLSVDGSVVDGFVPDTTLGGLPAKDLPPAFASAVRGSHTITVTSAGSLAPTSPAPGDLSALDPTQLADMVIYVRYRLA